MTHAPDAVFGVVDPGLISGDELPVGIPFLHWQLCERCFRLCNLLVKACEQLRFCGRIFRGHVRGPVQPVFDECVEGPITVCVGSVGGQFAERHRFFVGLPGEVRTVGNRLENFARRGGFAVVLGRDEFFLNVHACNLRVAKQAYPILALKGEEKAIIFQEFFGINALGRPRHLLCIQAMEQPITTLQQAIQYFGEPRNCRKFVVFLRWPDGILQCPHCVKLKKINLAGKGEEVCMELTSLLRHSTWTATSQSKYFGTVIVQLKTIR